ncbi:hypothetical protein B0H15DRAFT_298873 [Mycena belliarum]|uniref:Uncharacterized protein n=1 Tax=Mycena belliarum TaxID=1033014 RepID=A0AAD6U3W8_9AGAR|nr:hypothetical protein B0H15DRAFT_298873 [Mycena belliae]
MTPLDPPSALVARALGEPFRPWRLASATCHWYHGHTRAGTSQPPHLRLVASLRSADGASDTIPIRVHTIRTEPCTKHQTVEAAGMKEHPQWYHNVPGADRVAGHGLQRRKSTNVAMLGVIPILALRGGALHRVRPQLVWELSLVPTRDVGARGVSWAQPWHLASSTIARHCGQRGNEHHVVLWIARNSSVTRPSCATPHWIENECSEGLPYAHKRGV